MLLDYSKTEQCYQLTQLLSRLHLNLVGVRNMYIGVKNLLSLMIKLNVPKTSLKFLTHIFALSELRIKVFLKSTQIP